jgi:hypothetical protein
MLRFFRPILQFQGGQHLPEWQFCLWITFINHDPKRSVLGGQLSPIYPDKTKVVEDLLSRRIIQENDVVEILGFKPNARR